MNIQKLKSLKFPVRPSIKGILTLYFSFNIFYFVGTVFGIALVNKFNNYPKLTWEAKQVIADKVGLNSAIIFSLTIISVLLYLFW